MGKVLMNMQILVHIGLLCIIQKLKLFIFTVLVLKMFLKKLKNLLGIKKKKKQQQQIYLEYK